MATSAIVFLMMVANGFGATTPKSVVEKQNRAFEQYWGTAFVWKFDDLPTTGTVPNFRVPYSGHIYTDRSGGTVNSLRKYDQAFHGGRPLAVGFEEWDTTAFKKTTPRKGPLGMTWGMKMETPNWHGHCNGWTAAAIRHAEPKNNVTVNGVTFTPADIKGLLAEIYMYNDVDHLAGVDDELEPGHFHAILANWLGRGAHTLGMEADPSEEKWNYPIYAFSSSSAKRSPQRVEVKLNLAYIKDSNGEYQVSPRYRRVKSFHYDLYLNAAGEIIGGKWYNDSALIDMLWLPLRPKQGRQKGNESGSPYVDVNKVLAIWRQSADPEERERWVLVDPPKEDRITNIADIKTLIPVQDPHAPRPAASVATVPWPNPWPATTSTPPATTSTPSAQPGTPRVQPVTPAPPAAATVIPAPPTRPETRTETAPVARAAEIHLTDRVAEPEAVGPDRGLIGDESGLDAPEEMPNAPEILSETETGDAAPVADEASEELPWDEGCDD
ncbi:MAG: hypothetical protein GX575_12080 [Candidatus Anammoximicrobium sp.]|nr:hypothetical protein [Candidatus Anammoximicrobium sp.]